MTASRFFYETSTAIPTEDIKHYTIFDSFDPAFLPKANPDAPDPIKQGVLGMTLTIFGLASKCFSIVEILIPAAILITKCFSFISEANCTNVF